MRAAVVRVAGWLAVAGLAAGALGAKATAAQWRQVHPHWQDAYVFSFRSPDLLTNQPDEQWGQEDGRLVSGGILTVFPLWLQEQKVYIEDARRQGRPILLSIHVHSGYGTGLVTYSPDLRRAEAVNYPWLVRQLTAAGLNADDVTVAVDTCNAQATAAHQLRPDLVPGGVEGWSMFKQWRGAAPARRKLPLSEAYRLFSQDYVAKHLERPARGVRANVAALPYQPLTAAERSQIRMKLYGPRGVILATPALANLLRLGPEPRNTLTANLLRDPLERSVIDGLLARNKSEFRRFNEYSFLSAAGLRYTHRVAPRTVRSTDPAPTGATLSREERVERDGD